MVKRVIWTVTAQKHRKEILEYWIIHNYGSTTYAKKLSAFFKKSINLIKSRHYLGKPTDFRDVRVTIIQHFSIFYKVNGSEIIIVGIWDNRRNPDDLHKNLEF